jgi:uncharacterized membrane protein
VADVAQVREANALRRRQERAASWMNRIVLLLAWIVAVCRLELALTHHEVFGVVASMAFLVAVLMPLVHARSIAVAVREVAVELRRGRTERRKAEFEGSGTPAPAPPHGPAGRSLQ